MPAGLAWVASSERETNSVYWQTWDRVLCSAEETVWIYRSVKILETDRIIRRVFLKNKILEIELQMRKTCF